MAVVVVLQGLLPLHQLLELVGGESRHVAVVVVLQDPHPRVADHALPELLPLPLPWGCETPVALPAHLLLLADPDQLEEALEAEQGFHDHPEEGPCLGVAEEYCAAEGSPAAPL